MTRYVFRRLGGAIIILWVIITVTFTWWAFYNRKEITASGESKYRG